MSFSSPSGLCNSSVHPAEGLRHWEATVDVQPLRYQQRRIHQQRGVCLCACLTFITGPICLHFYVNLTLHVSFVCVYFCFTGDDRHRQSDIRHDGEVHLPCLENWRTKTACGCLLSGNNTWDLYLCLIRITNTNIIYDIKQQQQKRNWIVSMSSNIQQGLRANNRVKTN